MQDDRREFALQLLEAREGSQEALGRLLESYRTYLLLIANQAIAPDLRPKIAASDLVQETFLDVREKFGDFRGETELQWKGWIRQVLMHDLQDARRRFQGTQKRMLAKEVSLQGEDDSRGGVRDLEQDSLTPRGKSIAREEENALMESLEQLPDDYRRVVELRNWQLMSFEEIGGLMGRSSEAARKLWTRAIDQLGEKMKKGS